MMPRTLRSSLVLLVAATLAACQTHPASVGPMAPPPGAAVPEAPAFGPHDTGVILRGRVHWSTLRRLMATAAEVGSSATVTLYNAQNLPVAAGLADSGGAFTLYQSTVPLVANAGDLFTLEVTRRAPSDSLARVLSLRTVLRSEGANVWTSITGQSIVVSALTTAIAQLDADDASTSLNDVIEKVTDGVPSPFGLYTLAEITAREATITERLTANADPNQLVLEHFPGSVTITDAKDLALAQHIGSIAGSLTIRYTGSVPVALPRLKSVAGTLWIDSYVVGGTPSPALPAFAALTAVGDLAVDGGAFTSLVGLDALTSAGAVALNGMHALTSLQGFNNLTTVDTIFQIRRSSSLADLSALAKLAAVRTFQLEDLTAPGLTGLGNMPLVTELAFGLTLSNLPHVTSLDAFSGLTTVVGLTILDMPALTSLMGTASPTLSAVEGLTINGAGLTSLAGLGGVSGANFRLSVSNCPALTSLSGLGNVTSLLTLTLIRTSVTNFSGLPDSLTTIGSFGVRDSLATAGPTVPTDLAGLTGITITSEFSINNVPTLTSLAGPTFAAGLNSFGVSNCAGITTLSSDNLLAILGVGSHFTLFRLPNLTSVSGLNGLLLNGYLPMTDPLQPTIATSGSASSFTISECPKLPPCDAIALWWRRGSSSSQNFDYDVNAIVCP